MGADHLSGAGSGGQVTLSGHGVTSGTPRLDVRIEVLGTQVGDGLSVGSGTMTIVPPDGAATYRGPVTGISETGGLQAALTDGHGDRITVTMDVAISRSGSLSGDLAIRDLSAAGSSGSGDQE